eukprot:COSAG05_NODE_24139_length_253_cov_1.116883_1_plen_45_part_10
MHSSDETSTGSGAGFGDPLIALAVETPTIMVAKRACTADITITRA